MSDDASSFSMANAKAAMGDLLAVAKPAVNWRQVAWFLGLAFGLAWLIDLVIYLNGGLAQPGTQLLMQFMMMIPAFSALLLNVFFFSESPVYFRTNRTPSRWFIYYFFLMTLVFLIGAVFVLIEPGQVTMISQLLTLLSLSGLILLIVLRLVGGKTAFSGVGMGFGSWRYWVLLGLGLVIFYSLETLLNYLFKLGQPSYPSVLLPAGTASNIPSNVLVIQLALSMIVTGPLLGLIISFGEEYGWRGFLQSQLVRLGRVRGVLLLGVIWGVWHWPVIWMGYNYPGQPLLGSLMMVAYCIVLSFFLAYAVFKSKGVWSAAYLHALNNQTLSFFMLALYMPTNLILSFGIGIPGLALAALVVIFLLRDPVWKEPES